jgi:prepilin-type N-terminal cleavage/methylation domain-containing protein
MKIFNHNKPRAGANDDSRDLFKNPPHSPFIKGGSCGFTLIEVVLAMVIIGIAVTGMLNAFSGLKDIKKPEYTVQGSFLAMKQMEAISKYYYNQIPPLTATVGTNTYTCAQFSAIISTIDCTNTNYTFSWQVDNVSMATPNTVNNASVDLGKKVTLTVTRNDGGIGSMLFYTLYSPLSTE